MPVHDWTQVDAGVFHHFHTAWLVEISTALNEGLLPSGYYALAEQAAGRRADEPAPDDKGAHTRTSLAMPPKVKYVFRCERRYYRKKQRRLAIRHRSNDRLVAIVEIVSTANKADRSSLRTFIDKAASILLSNINLLVIDLYPPTRRDPHGIDVAIWRALGSRKAEHDPAKPLTLVSYDVADDITAYVEPIAVGDRLRDMPLFLENERYIDVPLEATYRAAWRGVPRHLQHVLSSHRPQ
jgi:hypothetical protein